MCQGLPARPWFSGCHQKCPARKSGRRPPSPPTILLLWCSACGCPRAEGRLPSHSRIANLLMNDLYPQCVAGESDLSLFGSLIGSLYRPFFVPLTRRCRRGRKSSAVHTLLSSLAFMSPNVTTAPVRCHQFHHLHRGGGSHHRSVRMLTVSRHVNGARLA
jgi:hypothetical protein